MCIHVCTCMYMYMWLLWGWGNMRSEWLQWSGCGQVILSHEATQVNSLGEQRKRKECKDRWRERELISWEVLIAI